MKELQKNYGISQEDMTELAKTIGLAVQELKEKDLSTLESEYKEQNVEPEEIEDDEEENSEFNY